MDFFVLTLVQTCLLSLTFTSTHPHKHTHPQAHTHTHKHTHTRKICAQVQTHIQRRNTKQDSVGVWVCASESAHTCMCVRKWENQPSKRSVLRVRSWALSIITIHACARTHTHTHTHTPACIQRKEKKMRGRECMFVHVCVCALKACACSDERTHLAKGLCWGCTYVCVHAQMRKPT